jgi:hypothetical protein
MLAAEGQEKWKEHFSVEASVKVNATRVRSGRIIL